MKHIAFTALDRLILVVLGRSPPTGAEWDAYLLWLTRQGVVGTSQLIWTDGGCPTRDQLRNLDGLMAGRTVPTAVVTASAPVRATVATLSLLRSRVRGFGPASLVAAVAFLEVPASRVELVARELGKLRLELAGELGAS